MKIGESLAAVVCLVLPVVVLLLLLLGWLLRRAKPRPGIRVPTPPAMVIERVVQAASSVAVATVESIATIEASIVAQIGVVAQMTIQAVGYAVAQLRGVDQAPIVQVSEAGRHRHVVAHGQTYELDIGLEREQPGSYRGAKVVLVAPDPEARLDILVEGVGVEVSEQGQATLPITPGPDTHTAFRIRPARTGETELRIAFHSAAGWAQRLDLRLDVRSQEKVEELKRQASEGTALVGTVEGSITLPLLPADPAPRHLCLDISYAPNKEEGRTYSAWARYGREKRKIDLLVREADLDELNVALREALDVVWQYFGDQIEVGADEVASEEYLEVLDQLARRGNAAFKRIFPAAEDRDYILHALAQAEDANLEISTDSFFLPWELLYDTYDPGAVDYRNFWGLRYNISRVLTTVRQKQPPRLSTTGSPRLSLFANPDLPSVNEHEVPYFRKLQGEGRIYLWDWQKDAQPEQEAPLRQQRSTFFKYSREHESEVAHFACHAKEPNPRYSGDSYIELSDELQVRLEDMDVEDYIIGGMPVVVLNACGTGIRDVRKTSDFVRSFMLHGGRGVLATECDVPDAFASVFIQDVYDRVLQGHTFGQAILAARRYFLQNHRNPLGLLYAAYLSLETQILPSQRPDTAPARA